MPIVSTSLLEKERGGEEKGEKREGRKKGERNRSAAESRRGRFFQCFREGGRGGKGGERKERRGGGLERDQRVSEVENILGLKPRSTRVIEKEKGRRGKEGEEETRRPVPFHRCYFSACNLSATKKGREEKEKKGEKEGFPRGACRW